MKIMSVDYGDARTGIAFCDESETLAGAYCTITQKYYPKLLSSIADIISREKPKMVVVGLPVNMDGTLGFRADKCRELGDDISRLCGIDVVYEDERMTTVMAHGILSSNNVKGKKRKDKIDAVSAVLILQSYLDKAKKY